MTPCLLGPRHGHIVGEKSVPGDVLMLATEDNTHNDHFGAPCHFYVLGRFRLNDGTIRNFYYWSHSAYGHHSELRVPGATKEQAEKAVDDYVYAEKRQRHTATWEDKTWEPHRTQTAKGSMERGCDDE